MSSSRGSLSTTMRLQADATFLALCSWISSHILWTASDPVCMVRSSGPITSSSASLLSATTGRKVMSLHRGCGAG
ncbi:hypothetical protein LINGRAHAP2_LOCUS34989 [Linum grandiflorum]